MVVVLSYRRTTSTTVKRTRAVLDLSVQFWVLVFQFRYVYFDMHRCSYSLLLLHCVTWSRLLDGTLLVEIHHDPVLASFAAEARSWRTHLQVVKCHTWWIMKGGGILIFPGSTRQIHLRAAWHML